MSTLKVVCSNCHEEMRIKEGNGIAGISHSVCKPCIIKLWSHEFTAEEMQEILNTEED